MRKALAGCLARGAIGHGRFSSWRVGELFRSIRCEPRVAGRDGGILILVNVRAPRPPRVGHTATARPEKIRKLER